MRTSKSTHYPFIRLTGVANPYTGEGNAAAGTTTGVMTTTNGKSAGAVHYIEIGGVDDLVQSIQIAWPDATSSATIVLETTNFFFTASAPDTGAPYARSDESDGYRWTTEPGVVITGPSATAAGSVMVHLGNVGSRRARLKITVAANTQLYIIGHGKQ